MDTLQRRIKSACTVLVVGSLLASLLYLVNGVWDVARELGLIKGMQTWHYNQLTWPYLLDPFLYSLGLGYLAFVFFSMRREGAPFSRKTATRLKLLSIVFLIVLSLPRWIMELQFLVTDITVIRDGLGVSFLIFPVVVAVTLYGLALIFQYGLQLQTDSNEIV